MADNGQPRRRRRTPMTEPDAQAQDSAQQETEQPHRIVAAEDDTPEWMVSASRVSGAAERRGGTGAKGRTQEPGAARKGEPGAAFRGKQKGADSAEKAEQPRSAAPGAERPNRSGTDTADPQKTAARRTPPQKKQIVYAAKEDEGKAEKPARPRKKTTRTGGRKAAARRRAQIGRTIACSLGALLLIVLMGFGIRKGADLVEIKQALDRGNGVFYPNIFINNIPLEGMTLDEAAAVVERQVKAQVDAFSITLRTTDGTGRTWNITGEDLKMQYNVADQLDQLWSIGHTGSTDARYAQVKALENEPVVRHTPLTYDLSIVNQIITQIKQEVDKSPVNAMRLDDDTKWPPYSYTDDEPGQELDISGLNEQICGMVNRLESGVVDLTPKTVQAPVTRAYLESQIVQLSTYETAIGATSDPGRFINIEVGTRKFDKLIIRSGESVSFNKVAEKRTYANGYADAPELAYGDYRTGVGGGICQVSSTLYNAVVGAGLEVKTRYQHSLASNYVPLGLDATVQDDRLDFVFKNTTNADIFISTDYYKKKGYWYTKFTIHGRPDPNGYSYKLESRVVEEIPVPEPTYIPDKNAEYVVYEDETQQISNGHKGYVVDVYLVTMDSKGLEVSREKKYTDTYKASVPKVYVGVTPRETPEPPNDNTN